MCNSLLALRLAVWRSANVWISLESLVEASHKLSQLALSFVFRYPAELCGQAVLVEEDIHRYFEMRATGILLLNCIGQHGRCFVTPCPAFSNEIDIEDCTVAVYEHYDAAWLHAGEEKIGAGESSLRTFN